MFYRKSFATLCSWLVGLAALGLFYSGEALAVCCKTLTSCQCYNQLSCSPTQGTKVTSCTNTSSGPITLNGSEISCISGKSVGQVAADPGDSSSNPPVPAEVQETAAGVSCQPTDGSGPAAQFDARLVFTWEASTCVDDDADHGYGNSCNFTDNDNTGKGPNKGSTPVVQQPVCHTNQQNPLGDGRNYDVLDYSGFCGALTTNGHLVYVGGGEPPDWVKNFGGNQLTPATWGLVLGGWLTDRKGNPICSMFGALGELSAGKVIQYREYFAPAEITGQPCSGDRVNASDMHRRLCHDHTFYNPDWNFVTDTGTATNLPCDPTKGTTFVAGIKATDVAQADTVVLPQNAWNAPTLNLSCSNQGNVPTKIPNDQNFAASSFTGGTIVAYVTGFPDDTSPATSTSVTTVDGVPTGLQANFNDCNTFVDPSDNTTIVRNGLDQVICRHVSPTATTVNLTISASRPEGLGFEGMSTFSINNAESKCAEVLSTTP